MGSSCFFLVLRHSFAAEMAMSGFLYDLSVTDYNEYMTAGVHVLNQLLHIHILRFYLVLSRRHHHPNFCPTEQPGDHPSRLADLPGR